MAQYDVTALSTPLQFDVTNAQSVSSVKVPGKDWIAVSWMQSTTLVYVQAFSINTGTGALTAIGSPLDIEAGTVDDANLGTSIVAIDGSNLAVAWCGPDVDGFVRLISLDGSGNCATNGSALEYSTADGLYPSMILWDSTHVLIAYQGASADGFAIVVSFNTGTGVMSNVGTAFEFDTGNCSIPSVVQLNSTKALVSYTGVSADGFAVVLDVAAVTFAVSAAGATFEYLDATTINGNTAFLISSGSPMVACLYYLASATPTFRTFNISTTTWAITAFGTALQFSNAASGLVRNDIRALGLVDSTTLIGFYPSSDDDGFVTTMAYNSGDGSLTAINTLEFDTTDGYAMHCVNIGGGWFGNVWQRSSNAGFMQVFNVASGSSVKLLNLLGVGT